MSVRIVKQLSKCLVNVLNLEIDFKLADYHLHDLCCVSSDFTSTLASSDILSETALQLPQDAGIWEFM